MKNVYRLEVKSGVSRGRDTYGYGLRSLYVDGKKVAMTNGGGYDMAGTVLGAWITGEFQELIRKLPANYGSLDENKDGFYGLVHRDPSSKDHGRLHKATKTSKSYCDGMCGWDSMEKILEAIGFQMLPSVDGGYVVKRVRKTIRKQNKRGLFV